MRRRVLTTLSVALLLASGACDQAQIVPRGLWDAGPRDGSTDGGGDASPPVDGGPGTCPGTSTVVGMPEGCTPARPPPRPTCDGDDGPPLLFALRDIEIDQAGGDRWRTIGFDLDGLCSENPDAVVECVAPSGDTVGDGDDGVDNVFGQVLGTSILLVDETLEDQARAKMAAGELAVLVRVTGYAGTPDDAQVRVVIAQSVRAAPADPVATELAWDGTDTFYAGDATFLGGAEDMPLILDDNAYVAGRVLVARLPDRVDLDVSSDTGTVRLNLTDARLTGRISPDGTRLEDATVSGRWARTDILAMLPFLGVCPGDPLDAAQQMVLENLLARTMDVRSAPGSGGAGVECDAISFAVRLQGVAAQWGGVEPSELVVSACP